MNPEDSDVLADEIGGPVERIWLEKSFHVATLDYDQAEVESATVAFAQRSPPAEQPGDESGPDSSVGECASRRAPRSSA